jgi:hypothetical protein
MKEAGGVEGTLKLHVIPFSSDAVIALAGSAAIDPIQSNPPGFCKPPRGQLVLRDHLLRGRLHAMV